MRKSCVFVVEDEDVIRHGIVTRLTRQHFLVRDFGSGESVLRFIELHQTYPDVILLDYKMPGISGLETLVIIKSQRPKTVGIILTADRGVVNEEAARNAGVWDVVTKTVELDGLVQIVKDALTVGKVQYEGLA
ncbi:response regulator [Candidatus Nitrospira salsa]